MPSGAKRGVGKSTVTALLGMALRDIGKKVGLLDVDLSGSSWLKALGLQSPPRFRTSTVRRKLIPPQVMGMRLFSICAHFGEGNAVMWKADTGIVEIPDEVRKGLRKQTYVSNRAEVVRQMLSTQVEWPENTEMLLADMPPSTASKVFSFFDNMSALLGCIIVTQPSEISALGMRDTVCFLKLQEGPITKTMRRGNSPFTAPRRPPIVLADMPPSTASEVFSFFDNMDSLLGYLIVTQPSDISALGMTRTIDFLRHKQIPIMGLVTMMDGYLCPHCGKVSHQLLSPKLAMEKVARECGVPFLISIPQTPDVGLLKPYFDSLAKMVLKGQPITLKKQNLLRRVQG